MGHARWASLLRMVVVDDGRHDQFCGEVEAAGVSISRCSGGTDALIGFGHCAPHAVLLPARLHDVAVVEVVAAMRRRGSQPILVAVEAGEGESVGPALMAGASAAVALPYLSHEVLGWLARALPILPIRDRLTFGSVTLDPLAHTVRVGHVELAPLPLKEFALLSLFMTRADHLVPLPEIKATVWAGAKVPSNNTVAVHVQRLRRRLPRSMDLLTVRGLGYRLTCTSTTGVGSDA